MAGASNTAWTSTDSPEGVFPGEPEWGLSLLH